MGSTPPARPARFPTRWPSWYPPATSRTRSSSWPGDQLALTNPELDLLRELLEEEPAADAYADVARDLVRRGAWVEAFRVLERAAGFRELSREMRGLHAKAALVGQLFHRAIEIVGILGPDAKTEPEVIDVEIIARRALGDQGRATALSDALELLHPGRLPWVPPADAEPPQPRRRALGIRTADPLITASRAEAYVSAGRPDRAIRVYRRLLRVAPEDLQLRRRLGELLQAPKPERLDDLSDEIPAPGAVTLPSALPRVATSRAPPGLAIPVPRAFTPTHAERRETDRFDDDEAAGPGEFDDEITDSDVRRERDAPKRRRSLIARK